MQYKASSAQSQSLRALCANFWSSRRHGYAISPDHNSAAGSGRAWLVLYDWPTAMNEALAQWAHTGGKDMLRQAQVCVYVRIVNATFCMLACYSAISCLVQTGVHCVYACCAPLFTLQVAHVLGPSLPSALPTTYLHNSLAK